MILAGQCQEHIKVFGEICAEIYLFIHNLIKKLTMQTKLQKRKQKSRWCCPEVLRSNLKNVSLAYFQYVIKTQKGS